MGASLVRIRLGETSRSGAAEQAKDGPQDRSNPAHS